MTRVALLGGSFNPPHVAHQMLALWALSTDAADEVWLMPCHQHAFHKKLVAIEHRRAMCELAAAPLPAGRVQVTSVEQTLGAPSRTLRTLQHLHAERPDLELALLIGADILQEKDSWYRFDEIERLARILAVGRVGFPSPGAVPDLPPISSTQIRAALAGGENPAHLVPAAVLGYIRAHQLYTQADSDGQV